MQRIESSILVSKSMGEVFAFLNRPENHLKFIPNMVEFHQTSAGVFGQTGARVDGTLKIFGRKIRVPYEIVEHAPDSRFAMKGLIGPVSFRDGYVLSSSEGGSRIGFWLELTLEGLGIALAPFATLIGRVHAHETLANLKRELETYRSPS